MRTLLQITSLLALSGALSVQAASGTWTNTTSGGLWSATGNWLGGTVADGDTFAADFSTLNLAADNTVHLDASHTLSNLLFGDTDTSTAAGWLLDDNGSAGANILTLGTTPTIKVNQLGTGKQVTISGVVGGSAGLTKTGAGTLDLSGADTLTGGVTINGGTLTLDFTTGTTTVLGSQALALGGGTLNILGANPGPSSQTFASTAFNSGANVISAAPTPGGSNPTLTLGAFTFAASSVQFVGPATTNSLTSSTVAATATITTTTVGTGTLGLIRSGALTAYATVGLYDWASTDLAAGTAGTSPYTIIGGSQVTGFYTTLASGNVGASSINYDVTGATAGSSSSSTYNGDTLRFNTAVATTFTVSTSKNWGCAGMLVTPNVGANNVTFVGNGTGLGLGNNNANPISIFQNNTLGELIFNSSSVMIRGTGTYIQSGPGTVVQRSTSGNAYTGATYLNGGVTEITSDAQLGGTAGSIVTLNGGTLVGNYNGNLDNGTTAHPIALGNNGGGLGAVTGTTLTVDGVVSDVTGAGPLVIGIPASSANGSVLGQLPGTGTGTANSSVLATGTLILNNTGNTYTGGTILDSGILQLTVNNLAVLGTGNITLNGGTFQWNGVTTDISSRTVTLASGGGTLGVNGNTVTLANPIGNGGSGVLTVASATPGGMLILGAANTYTGGTTVNGGATLLVNGSTSSGAVAVYGVLGGTGTVGGNTTFEPGGSALLTAGSPLTVSGSVTLNNTTVNTTTALTTGTYTLLNATSISGTINSTPAVGSVAPGYSGTVSVSGGNSIVLTVVLSGVTGTWTDASGTDNNWSDAGNWSGGVPQSAGDTAIFGNTVSPVVLDASKTVGALYFNQASSYTITGGNTLTLDNKGAGGGAQISVTAGANTISTTTVALNDNVIAVVNSGNSLAISSTVTNASTPETLTLNGGGTLALSGNNSYGPSAGSVGTIVSGGGTLQVGNNNALGFGDVTNLGSSTLQAGASGLTVGNNIGIGSGVTATVDNNGYALTLGGVIGGNGSLTKIGNGTLSLGGANTYAGNTTISGGVVSISADGSLGAVPGSITANSITINGGDLLASAGNPALNVNRGITLTGSGLLDAASGQTFTVNGNIAGTNNLTLNSGVGNNGMVVLTNANTFSGTTILSAGTLQLANSLALQNSTLNYSGGTLDFGSLTAATLGGLSGTEAGQNLSLVNGSSAAVALTVGGNNATTSYGGQLSGAGLLTKVGAGTLTLSNATYTGNTTANGGNLTIAGGASGSASSTILVGNGTAGTLNVTGGSVTAGTLNIATVANSTGSAASITGTGSGTFNAVNMASANNTGGSLTINTVGTVALGVAIFNRDTSGNNSPNPNTAAGLIINNGTVTATSFEADSSTALRSSDLNLNGGSLTIGTSASSGAFRLATGVGNGFVTMTNGTLTYLGTDGLLLNLNAANNVAGVKITGGTANLTGVTLNQINGANQTSSLIVSNGATLYLGGVGLVVNQPSSTNFISLGNGGATVGALADWSSVAPITLAGPVTFSAADASSAAHNISLGGAISGTGPITKTGGGTLTLSGANSYINGTTVNNGVLNINGINALGGANYGGLTLNGTKLQYAAGSTGNGSLDLTSIGTAGVTIGPGADIIDVNGNNVSFANSIGNYGAGGLTVQSTTPGGVLNFNGTNTYAGNTTVASGAALGGSGTISNTVEIQSGGILAPGNNAVGTLTVGALTLDSGAIGNFEFNGVANDEVVATGGLTINGGVFNLYQAGGTLGWTQPGTYNLIQYTGPAPVLDSSWTTTSASNPHVANPQVSFLYSFHASGGYLILKVSLNGTAVSGTWTNTAASGSWAAAANWDSNPNVPHVAGDLATFGNGTSLTTVTLDGSKSVGTITFNNNNSYQITPGSGGTLTLDKNGFGANVFVSGGVANQIGAPVSLNDNATFVVGSGKSLAISGNVGNASSLAGTLTVNQPGTLALSGNNSYGPAASSGFGTTLSGGATVQVGNNNALGAGDMNFAGNSTLQAGAAGLSVANNIDVSPGVTATVDTSGNNLALNGVISDSGNLTKIGNGTLSLPDNQINTYTGITTVNGGILSVAYDGDVYYSSSIILNGGILLGNGQSGNGFTVSIVSQIGIGPTSGGAGGTALLDAVTGTTLYLQGIMASAGNTGTNNLVVNSGAGDNGTVYMAVDGNTYNGTTVISNGLLWVALSLPLSSSTLNYNNQGGYLWVDGGITSVTLGGLSGAQNLGLTNLNGNGLTLTVGNNNVSTTYSGNLNDAGSGGALTKSGTGTLTLTGTNKYNGTTTANTGTLAVNGGSLVTSNTLTLNGGTLRLTNGAISIPALDVGVGAGGSLPGTVIVGSGTASFGTTRISSGTINGGAITINGGTVAFGNFTDRRDSSANGAADAANGLTINGGTVTANSVLISTGNSAANLHLKGGSLTIGDTNTTGGFTVGSGTSGSRGGFVTQTGGSLTYLGADGLLLGVSTVVGDWGVLTVNSNAVATLSGVTVNSGNTAGVNSSLTVGNGATIYLGGVGLVVNQPSATSFASFGQATVGALTNWSSAAPITLSSAAGTTFKAADPSNVAHNITLSNVLSGAGGLTKTGNGILTLSGTNTYTGSTVINTGTLALAPGASLASTPQINIASNATFDVSALGGFTFTGASPVQTLAGYSGLGTANVNATGNALTLASGAKALFQAVGGVSPTVGKISVAGDLALNANTITVNVGVGILGVGTYRLLDCTGNLSGTANATPAFTGLGATPGAAVSISTTTGAAGHVDLTVGKATPILQTATASSILLGQALSNSTLTVTFTNTAGTNVPGTAVFTSPGTVPLVAGTANYQVQFTPNDTVDYNTPTAFNVSVTVISPVLIPTQSAGITGFSLVDGNVVISGTNGQSGGMYYLLASTNLALPLSQWLAVATNVVNTNGNNGAFTFMGTNAVSAGKVQQFYILSNTNN